ncbi:MAG: oxidoreductase [Comamonadaceae bacterium]|nr:oxidoreductase [Comamonadaceae bacterium]
MTNRNQYITSVVSQVHDETERVRRYSLKCVDGWELPPFTAGAHIDVVLESGDTRQYSLCSDPRERNEYQFAVLREDVGRGGSLEIHQNFKVGTPVSLWLPRNLFPLAESSGNHILIAGGVGITPFISMIFELERRSASYELHYCARTASDFAFREFLLSSRRTGQIHLYADGKRLEMEKVLGRSSDGQHAYCCGPTRMAEAFAHALRDWPEHQVHQEAFGKLPVPQGPTYEVVLRRSNLTLTVVPGKSLLHTLKDAGLPMKVGCESGICTLCKVPWVAGAPIHRDHVLTSTERETVLLSCVCGSDGDAIELDL